jgi:hypothetical protein
MQTEASATHATHAKWRACSIPSGRRRRSCVCRGGRTSWTIPDLHGAGPRSEFWLFGSNRRVISAT